MKQAQREPKAGLSKTAIEQRHKLFVEMYLTNGGNATRAAISAGYSPRSAEVQGHKLVHNPKIEAEINRRRAALLNKYELKTEAVLKELARIVYFDIGKCFDENGVLKQPHEIDEDTRRALASYKGDGFKAFSKPEALGRAMQHLHLLPSSNINVTANAQAIAAHPEKRSLLEAARRIAFVLSMGADEVPKRLPEPKLVNEEKGR